MSHAARLYLVSPPVVPDIAAFADSFSAALEAGDIACFQLRLKSADDVCASDDDVLWAAEKLLPIAQAHNVAFLINDRPDLAIKAGVDGVHLGQSDTPLKDARVMLGDDAYIGVTCHNSRHLALDAGEAGADYVAFGAFFPTQTKTASTKADISLLEWWTYATTTQCVAIGGITPANCGHLVHAGADFVAVSGAVWNGADGPAAAVRAFNEALAAHSPG